ncbi:hypothetical protein [Pseudomonas matsuisoli]|uniref:Uncharacterized protein n=1 Tax=Pseudomonas matsuisoli TaxID=1515666 RepID=A0A917Q381_9PSED|nr:hypothetical protein [Pseudomonas matsuisoli]GGK09719.1 hypothetical protein GCM10009304_39700 [Pseudomonas matsuisoli]
MRIRGTIGQWPVDLTLDLDDDELGRLRALNTAPSEVDHTAAATPATVSAQAHDPHWEAAQDLLRQAGHLDGPALSGLLDTLTGSATTTKRLLVRLRHSPNVRLESGPDVHVYHWVDS